MHLSLKVNLWFKNIGNEYEEIINAVYQNYRNKANYNEHIWTLSSIIKNLQIFISHINIWKETETHFLCCNTKICAELTENTTL